MATPADADFNVVVEQDHDGRVIPNGRDAPGETWQVWAADAYAAVCELAGQVGFDLADA